MRRLFLVLAIIAAAWCCLVPPSHAADLIQIPSERKLDPRIRLMLSRMQEGLPPTPQLRGNSNLRPPNISVRAYEKDGRLWFHGLAKLNNESALSDLRRIGCRITSYRDSIACLEIPLDSVMEIAAIPEVAYLEASKRVRLKLDRSIPDIQVPEAASRYGTTGRGVIIGVVDSGIDVKHPDFIRSDGTSRVLYVWDQNDPKGPSPEGFGYGREYTPQDIDRALNGNLSSRPKDDDPNEGGHGTHICGIAASNGRASQKYYGVAPNADLIVVKADFDRPLDANRYIVEKAQKLQRPVVINNSWGSHYGPHDGTDLESAALNALVGPGKPGIVITVAAGNEGEDDIHVGGTVSIGRSASFSAFTPRGASYVQIDLWHDANDRLLTTVGYETAGGNRIPVASAETGRSRKTTITASPFSGARVTVDALEAPYPNNPTISHVLIDIDLTDTDYGGNPSMPWFVTLEKLGGTGSGSFDAWLSSEDGQYFRSSPGDIPGDSQKTVTDQACAPYLISVGSYITKTRWISLDGVQVDYGIPGYPLGSLSYFSSRGPTRDGKEKPDLVAPGEWIASSLSGDIALDFSMRRMLTEDGLHRHMQGTSMASPHVAGAAALLLEMNPSLDALQIQKLLRDTARRSSSASWTPDFGAGKLDVLAALQKAAELKIVYGDLNQDGKLDVTDALLAIRIAIGSAEASPEILAAGDVAPVPGTAGRQFGDGRITIADAVRILRRAIGIEAGSWP